MEDQTEALNLLKSVRSKATARSPVNPGLKEKTTDSQDSSLSSAVTQRSNRLHVRTIAERARQSVLTQLIDILAQIIRVEDEVSRRSSQEIKTFLRPKNNIDLRNICVRMAMSDAGCQSDRDLRELTDCLKAIVDSLEFSLLNITHCWAIQGYRSLKELYLRIPEI